MVHLGGGRAGQGRAGQVFSTEWVVPVHGPAAPALQRQHLVCAYTLQIMWVEEAATTAPAPFAESIACGERRMSVVLAALSCWRDPRAGS